MRRLLEWKYMNQQTNTTTNNSTPTASNKTSTGSNQDQTERYKKLLAQIDKEKNYKYDLLLLNDQTLAFELDINPVNNKTTMIAIVYNPAVNPPVWRMRVGNGTPVEYRDWNDILEVFEIPGIIKDISSLKESLNTNATSIVEDFETYNNLWSK